MQQTEEKESNEAEDDKRSDDEDDDEGSDQDNLGLPIMHWEALSLRIAELEKQEEQKRAKAAAAVERDKRPVIRTEDRGRRTESYEDGNDACNSHVLAVTSRLQTQMNLQLCFINNSESEEEEEEGGSTSGRSALQAQNLLQLPAKAEGPKRRGFRSALRNLRDRLRPDRTATAARRDPAVLRKHLDFRDLQDFRVEDLTGLCSSLSQTIQDLSSELVSRLHVRDQLRTEQDAMLLEVQDLTAL